MREWVEEGARKFALVAATPADFRDVMLEGESGLQHVFPIHERPEYLSSKRKVTFHTGAVAHVYSAHKNDNESGLRGPQQEKAWGDEPQKWKYPGNYDQLMLGLRIGPNPQAVFTCTPRPIKLIKDLVVRARKGDGVMLSEGTSYDNVANLAETFIQRVVRRYEGTRLGRQEVHGKLLEDVQGALWKLEWIERDRVTDLPKLLRVVVAVDPPAKSGQDGAECGIMVAGLGEDLHGYLLEDRSLNGTPAQWASEAVAAYNLHKADCIVAEINNGGEMVRHTIHSIPGAEGIPVRTVWASRGKSRRAEPISLLSEQEDATTHHGRIHHVGVFAELEDQLTTWVQGDDSPDRLDAYVWGFTELLVGAGLLELQHGSDEQAVVAVQRGAQELDQDIDAELRQRGVYFPGGR